MSNSREPPCYHCDILYWQLKLTLYKEREDINIIIANISYIFIAIRNIL